MLCTALIYIFAACERLVGPGREGRKRDEGLFSNSENVPTLDPGVFTHNGGAVQKGLRELSWAWFIFGHKCHRRFVRLDIGARNSSVFACSLRRGAYLHLFCVRMLAMFFSYAGRQKLALAKDEGNHWPPPM